MLAILFSHRIDTDAAAQRRASSGCRSTEHQLHRELFPGDVVVVRSGVLEAREKVVRFRHVLTNAESGEICSNCDFTVVCLDPQTRKSRPFPEPVLARARELLIPSSV